MSLRYFANGPEHALSATVADSSTTSIQVDSVAGWPTQYPFTIIIDPGGVLEEACDVTNVLGTTLTVDRGADSTLASAHAAGVTVVHGVTARDFREANTHINSTDDVHGTTGQLVDTDSVQSITGAKTFSDLNTTAGNVIDDAADQSIGGIKNFVNRPTTSSEGDVVTEGGANNFTGDNDFAASGTFDVHGTETHAGAETHTGTEDHQGAETHSGTETHSGDVTISGDLIVSGTVHNSNSVMQVVSASSTTDDSTTSSSYTAGASPVGVAFTAPPSGRIWVNLTAYLGQSINGEEAIVGWRIGTGSTVGAGTETVGPSGDRALVTGMAVNASAPARLQATRRSYVTGLTPGSSYNIEVMFSTTAGGNCGVFFREICIEPIL